MHRIDLPRELENELTLLAALTGKSVQFHDRIAAEKWLEDALLAEDGRPDARA